MPRTSEGAATGFESVKRDGGQPPLEGRAGIDLPPAWWPTPSELGAIKSAGFDWLQIYGPPVSVLASQRQAVCHGKAMATALSESTLETVVHAPQGLQLGTSFHDRAFEGLLEYAVQIGARQIVYHALDFNRRGRESAAEELSLRRMASWAEASGLMICLENLCSTYPGPAHVCHDPLWVRELVVRVDSPAVRMSFDVGHARVAAELMGTQARALLEPVVEWVALFHVHDNLGARRDAQTRPELDPARLDLHLPPGQGTTNWRQLAPQLNGSIAPLLLEIDPQWRWPAEQLHGTLLRAVEGSIPEAAIRAVA